jgi:predicted O-linked N-acetylglucosamine transferase (SPINDLY family)
MSLSLPLPATPQRSSAAQQRAHRKWSTAQAHALQDEWADAAIGYEQAYEIHQDEAYGLASAHAFIKAGRSDIALKRTQALRRQRPDLALAYTLESHAWLASGEPGEAANCLLHLPAELPRDRAHWVSLAISLQQAQRHGEAIPAFLQALATRADDAVLHFHLGLSFKDVGMKAEAAECVRTALLLGLGRSELGARALLVFLEREACRWAPAAGELAQLRKALAAEKEATAVETGPFPHAVFVDDPFEQLKVARMYARHVARAVQVLPNRPLQTETRRLRIGYLSADFHQHATSQLMVQMLEHHDRTRFEVTLLSAGTDDRTPMRARMIASCEHFEELRGRSHAQMAERIHDLGIDILVDVKGVTLGTLMPVMAHQPAPLQVSWLGFPGTSGAPYIDYFIGDPIVTPLAQAGHFSEKLALMPACYQPNDSRRALPAASRRSDWGAPEDVPLLCAFHQSYKISEEVFDSWCRVLHAVPDAVLWLMQWNTNVEAALREAARQRGIGPERLCFAPMLPLEQHLSRLACADLYIDAWPCNAHTTASEALWVGVPVVTIVGATFAQRVAASLLHNVGLDELVLDTVPAYERAVVALAQDTERRAALRAHLNAQRHRSPLFDGKRFAHDIEGLYERMWARAIAGLAPDHLAPVEPVA